MHFCASLLRIGVFTKLLSFVSALDSRKHKGKISLVTYPEFFSILYITICEIYIL